MAKTVLITGTSSGFGKLAAKRFSAEGWNVIATMRKPEKEEELTKLGENVLVTSLDVTDDASVTAAVAAGLAKFGAIDVLVNNAGYGNIGLFEGASVDDVKKQYETNVFGAMRVTHAVLPHMRSRKSGKIVNISSVLGEMTHMFSSVYASSKFALEGWSECLAYELAPFNIQIKIVQPGGFATDFLPRGMQLSIPADEYMSDYGPLVEAVKGFSGMTLPSADPLVPDAILKAATSEDINELRFPVFVESDGYGQLLNLRREKGSAAQFGAVLESLQQSK